MKIAIAFQALAFLALAAPRASAQLAFDGCGTVVQGVTCPKLFQADVGGLYVMNHDMTPYSLGDRLHVVGTIDAGCVTICMQGNGCINPTLVEYCTPATDLCFGDGSSGPCPCLNGVTGAGCANSNTQAPLIASALLTLNGTTNPDTVVMQGWGERPTSLTIFWQGTGGLAVPVFAGDGLRCIGGTMKRLYVKNAIAGAVSAPQAGDPSITQRSAQLNDPIAPGTTRHYQLFYRDGAPAWCPPPMGSTFNTTNAKSILW